MGYGHSGFLFLLFPILMWILASIPAYVVGTRTEVVVPELAFIPLIGPYIVLLRSTKRSGWWCILALIPFVDALFYIWLTFAIPVAHRRALWWAIAFNAPLVGGFAYGAAPRYGVGLPLASVVVMAIAFFAYAFSLDPYGRSSSGRSGGTGDAGLGSTYHVPPEGDWRL